MQKKILKKRKFICPTEAQISYSNSVNSLSQNANSSFTFFPSLIQSHFRPKSEHRQSAAAPTSGTKRNQQSQHAQRTRLPAQAYASHGSARVCAAGFITGA